jgi:hypothetical protein
MGSKYEFKADSNPPIGGYEIEDPRKSRITGGYIEPEA